MAEIKPWFAEKKIRSLFRKHRPKISSKRYRNFMSAVEKEFGWSEEEAYIATDFLFRPRNHN